TAAVVSLQALAAVPSSYTIVDLGTNRQPNAVNDAGTVVGDTINKKRPIVFAGGDWSHLHLKGDRGAAWPINSQGDVVGIDGKHQVQWKAGVRKILAGLNTNPLSSPAAIGDDGTVVGTEYVFDVDRYVPTCYAWKDGVVTTLPGIGGDKCYVSAMD